MGKPNLDLPIAEMRFTHNKWVTTRVRNRLRENNIKTLGELVERTEEDLVAIENLGAISIACIKAKLDMLGLKLKDPSW